MFYARQQSMRTSYDNYFSKFSAKQDELSSDRALKIDDEFASSEES